ncbi:hypothetical protein [Diaminobutyricibacter sp. McL0608]|uniref:hypothetical protein n=1 Tax=Leifsonia sp. McL0608 TaxID=3143537 RepID=UPI0031F2E551
MCNDREETGWWFSMRSSVPIPGNPWPRDMRLTIENDSQTLHELLWIREAWALPLPLDDPPRLVDTPQPMSRRDRLIAPNQEWTSEWVRLWDACVLHAATPRDPALLERLSHDAIDPEERIELLGQLYGPSWRGHFGDAALPDAYNAWDEKVRPSELPDLASPERDALDALIPAWEHGLTQIVVIPCVGDYARRVRDHGLLVTATTRNTPSLYEAALRGYVRQ